MFCNCAAGSFRPASVDADRLRSREPIAFICFVGPLCFCLPALSPTRSITKKIQHRPFACARVTGRRPRPFCLHAVAGNCCASTGYQYSCRVADTLIPLLPCGRRFFLFRTGLDASSRFPLAYLIFMVPMPDAMADALEMASKSATTEVTDLLFHLSGIPFLRSGAIFQLPNITIEVAQECSGIRSSWVLFMTSILAANLFLKTPWRRFALIAFVIPLGILRNAFRILVIGLLCVNVGPQMIHSVIHRRGGPVFFALSLIPLLLALWWLRKGDVRSRQTRIMSS